MAVGDESNWNDSRNNISAVMVQPPQGMYACQTCLHQILNVRTLNGVFYVPTEETPISIVVEGTTVEATDVDSVPDLMVQKYARNPTNESSEQSAVKRRHGAGAAKSRPISDGHILSHQYSDGNVSLILH